MSFVESNGTVWVQIAIGMEQENKSDESEKSKL